MSFARTLTLVAAAVAVLLVAGMAKADTITVPNGTFTSPAGTTLEVGANSSGTLTGPQTATITGWNVLADPSTYNSGNYATTKLYGGVCPTSGPNGFFGSGNSGYAAPNGTTTMFWYYGGEQLTGTGTAFVQPGADFTLTSTGISANAVTGTTYTASMAYADISGHSNVNTDANITFSILANGVPVGTAGTGTNLAYNVPWSTMTASWTATSGYAGQAIQVKIYMNHFTDGPAQYAVVREGFTNVTLSDVAAPEPATLTLLVTGLVGLLAYAWRRRQAA